MFNIDKAAKDVIDAEIIALTAMRNRLDKSFCDAVEIIIGSEGRLIVIGMGKSGLVGRKIAATLASTGTPSYFVHPAEAFHGDLGMIKPNDIILMITKSGETEEIIRLIPYFRYYGYKIIAMTGNLQSTLSKNSDVVLDISVDREACCINLAPTSSTTNMLVMGDALAIVISSKRNFKQEDFARFHPGGSLGRRLLTKVKDVMKNSDLPICTPECGFDKVIDITSKGRLGLAIVVENNKLQGIITSGDIRRAFQNYQSPLSLHAKNFMKTNPYTILPEAMIIDAERIMKENKINTLVVTDDNYNLCGVVHIFDLDSSA